MRIYLETCVPVLLLVNEWFPAIGGDKPRTPFILVRVVYWCPYNASNLASICIPWLYVIWSIGVSIFIWPLVSKTEALYTAILGNKHSASQRPTIWSFPILKKGSTYFHRVLYYFKHNRSMRHILKLTHRCCINYSKYDYRLKILAEYLLST